MTAAAKYCSIAAIYLANIYRLVQMTFFFFLCSDIRIDMHAWVGKVTRVEGACYDYCTSNAHECTEVSGG